MASFYAAARPTVTVQNPGGQAGATTLPAVFLSPIRPDVVRFVHTNMAKNHRQAYAVYDNAGHETAAISWGTGRAVSRIPRVPGSGTSRSGQGAFGNMCRKGRMFAPTRQWRRWHRKLNTNQKRYAVCSALAASALPALVLARGHRVERVAEVPLVVADSVFTAVKKTKQARELLKKLQALADVDKVKNSRRINTGRGKSRNRRYAQKRGPLVVYRGSAKQIRPYRNLRGLDFNEVSKLNLLNLAPGGHLGRFVIWTESAFKYLDQLYGNGQSATLKKGFALPRPLLANADIARVINSDEVQSVVKAAKPGPKRFSRKVNPLTNHTVMTRLNPYHTTVRRKAAVLKKRALAAKTKKSEEKKKGVKKPVKTVPKGTKPGPSKRGKYAQLLRKLD